MERVQRAQEWKLNVSVKYGQWKDIAAKAMGMSASMGLTIGGAAATAAGAAIAGFQGIACGVSGIADASLALPDIPGPERPEPDPDHVRPPKRPSSDTDIVAVMDEPPCPRCMGRKSAAHTYKKGCTGFPPSFYFAPRKTIPRLPIQASTASASTDPAPPVQAPVPTPEEMQEAAERPVSESRIPDSFGSANSSAQRQSYYMPNTGEGVTADLDPQAPDGDRSPPQAAGMDVLPPPTTPPTISTWCGSIDVTCPQLNDAVQELQRAIRSCKTPTSNSRDV